MSEIRHIHTHASRRALQGTNAHAQEPSRRRGIRGFTMTELLVVIAIIAVMAALAFVAIAQAQKDAQQLELDGTAKEIFIAAQNHLSEAEAQGILDRIDDDEKGSAGHDDGVYFFAVNGPTDGRLETPMNMLNVMLPYGSIDQTVRVGGTYVIEYDFDSATVLGVFYARSKASLFGASGEGFTFTDNDYDALFPGLEGPEHRTDRQNYRGTMIGYYGGEEAASLRGAKLNKPFLRVVNADRLEAIVTNNNFGDAFAAEKPTLILVIEGETSGARKTLTLVKNGDPQSIGTWCASADGGKTFHVFLDDITVKGGHFVNNFGAYDSSTKEGGFIPGENLQIRAIAYSNVKLTNIARSSKVRRNSLFGSLVSSSSTSGGSSGSSSVSYSTVKISNIRHLENLSYAISNFNPLNDGTKFIPSTGKTWGSSGGPMTAEQTIDLSWTAFAGRIAATDATIPNAGAVQIYDANRSSANTAAGSYMPVVLENGYTYDGKAHRVTDVTVSTSTMNAGLFDSAQSATIHDLELVNFNVSTSASSGTAGTLAGSLSNTTVTRVLAHNEVASGSDSGYAVVGADAAGGLVGSMVGGTMSGCAAAVYVSASNVAGGLVGTTTGNTAIGYSYSGGHTTDGKYEGGNFAANVRASTAGGLVGSLSGTITSCYSTCSAQGATVGRLVGSGGSGTGCYAVGSVNDEAWDITDLDGNELDTASYDALVGGGKSPAIPYDATLASKYGGKYSFKTVVELSSNASSLIGSSGSTLTKHLTAHYGDWPAIVTLVVNS